MQLPGLIIGGGIAGLTAAIALKQRGISAKVCEAAPQILPLGAGIWMAPNAMQVFERLGVADQVNAGGVPLRTIQIVDGQMRPILRTDQARVRQRFGHPTVAIRRAALQAILLAEIDPADVLLGKQYVGLTQDAAGVTVAFADGTTQRGGFVLAADGIHSPIRQQLFPPVRLTSTGHVVWRGLSAVGLAPAYRQAIMEAWAQGLRFGFSEIADGTVDWFAALPAGALGAERPGLKASLEAIFSRFTYPVPAILAAAAEDRILRTEITDFDPVPCWSQGRVCLIGDAAHAATPYMGQGGCQAVEDAYVVAQCLHREPDVAQAFAAMQRLRRPQARHIANTSRRLGQVGYLQGAAGAVRNFLLRSTPAFVLEQQFRRVYRLSY